MKKIILSFSLFVSVAAWAQKSDYPIQATPFTQVKLTDAFWLPRFKPMQRLLFRLLLHVAKVPVVSTIL